MTNKTPAESVDQTPDCLRCKIRHSSPDCEVCNHIHKTSRPVPSTKNYIIIRGTSSEVVRGVQELLDRKEGWHPLGGPIAFGSEIAQAVVLHEEETRTDHSKCRVSLKEMLANKMDTTWKDELDRR